MIRKTYSALYNLFFEGYMYLPDSFEIQSKVLKFPFKPLQAVTRQQIWLSVSKNFYREWKVAFIQKFPSALGKTHFSRN